MLGMEKGQQKLYSCNSPRYREDNFTLDELRKAINKMKPNKSPGTDVAATVETLKFWRKRVTQCCGRDL